MQEGTIKTSRLQHVEALLGLYHFRQRMSVPKPGDEVGKGLLAIAYKDVVEHAQLLSLPSLVERPRDRSADNVGGMRETLAQLRFSRNDGIVVLVDTTESEEIGFSDILKLVET